ncbi:unnamed protein product, partial [marine sediment metagenome]
HSGIGWSQMADPPIRGLVGTKTVVCHEFIHALGIRGPERLLITDPDPVYIGDVCDDIMDYDNCFLYPDVLDANHQLLAIQYALAYTEFVPVMNWYKKYDDSGYGWMIVGTKYTFTFKCGYLAPYV